MNVGGRGRSRDSHACMSAYVGVNGKEMDQDFELDGVAPKKRQRQGRKKIKIK